VLAVKFSIFLAGIYQPFSRFSW